MFKTIYTLLYGLSIISTSHSFASSYTLKGKIPKSNKSRTQKAYIVIEDKMIKKIVSSQKDLTEIEKENIIKTNGIILPGLIDLHNHLRYNVLPLWSRAKGQFTNRFEWRNKYPPYKDAVRNQLTNFKDYEHMCAAAQWAELKALTAGTTSLLGAGGIATCLTDTPVNNLERPESFLKTDKKVFLSTDIVSPDIYNKIFVPKIFPLMQEKSLGFEEAFQEYMQRQNIQKWFDRFTGQPHTLKNGLLLITGVDLLEQQKTIDVSALDQPEVETLLLAHIKESQKELSPKRQEKLVSQAIKFLYSPERPEYSYLYGPQTMEAAYDMFNNSGNIQYPWWVRSFVGKIMGQKWQFDQLVAQDKLGALVVHLAEGQNQDSYNQFEYSFAKSTGFSQKGLVIIHGLGLSHQDLEHAKENDISFVWSPFSNLLLYNETLDIGKMMESDFNLSLAPDWSPTGSKNLLDELKFAHRYLKTKGIRHSYRQLFDMVTINPAKALGLETFIGSLSPGKRADILVIDNLSRNPYKALVKAKQKNIRLVIIGGEAMYGDKEYLSALVPNPSQLQPLPIDKDSYCKEHKYLYRRFESDDYSSLKNKLSSLTTLEGQVSYLDPLFKCQDQDYTQRFEQFLNKELDKNIKDRPQLRIQEGLGQ